MLLAAILFVVTAVSARAVDKIQVYNAEIAKVGQWTFQLHLNYAFTAKARRRQVCRRNTSGAMEPPRLCLEQPYQVKVR